MRSLDASGRIAETTFDAQGRAVETTADPDNLALTASTTYDLLGRAITSTDAEDIVTRYQYDNLGRLVMKLENFSGGAPTCVQQSNVAVDTNICTTYEYDQAGNLVSRVLGNGSSTLYQYDARGQLILETVDPGGANITTAYTYDAAGNQVTLTRNPGGTPQVTTTVYDRLGRITRMDYVGDTRDVNYTYDAWGNRHQMVDVTGTWVYAYDAMNRLTSVTAPNQPAVVYGYNAAGNRTSLTYPDTTNVSYVYDSAGRLDTVSNPFGTGVVDYGYDDAGRVTSAALPGAVPDVTYNYDPAGRLIELVNGLVADPTSHFVYTLNGNGSRTDAAESLALPIPAAPTPTPTATETVTATMSPTPSETPTLTPTLEFTPTGTVTPSETPTETPTVTPTGTDIPTPTATETATLTPTAMPTPPSLPGEESGSHHWHYVYDGLKRLTYACSEWTGTECQGDEFRYFYDGASNITKMIRLDSGTTLYTYNGANEIATACTDANTNDVCDTGETQVAYQHDAYSNLTNDGRYEYVYDVTNRLVELKMSGQTVATSVYNGDGDLLSITVMGVTTAYVRDWASPEKVVLTETTGTAVTRNVYGLGLVAQQLPDSSVQYALYDGMHSIRQFADVDGIVTYTQTFDPFGGLYVSAGGSESAYGFMGLPGLGQSPLLYYKGQWYHTGLGRFIQPQSGRPNPYIPLMGLGLLGFGLLVGPKLRKKKWGSILFLMVLVIGSGLLMVACGGPTIPPTPPPTLPPTPPSTPTPDKWNIGDCYGDFFCERFGQKIADRAIALVEAQGHGVDVEPGGDAIDEQGQYIPFEQWSEGQQHTTLYVCADIIRDTYLFAGIDLQQLMTTHEPGWIPPPDSGLPADVVSRRTEYLEFYLSNTGQLKKGDAMPYTAGEIVLLADFTEGENASHSGVVVTGGTDPDKIIIVQASYSDNVVQTVSLTTYVNRAAIWALYPETKPETYAQNYARTEQIPFNTKATRVSRHGHPSASELQRIGINLTD